MVQGLCSVSIAHLRVWCAVTGINRWHRQQSHCCLQRLPSSSTSHFPFSFLFTIIIPICYLFSLWTLLTLSLSPHSYGTGAYKWADGKSISAFDATVVRIETNHGMYVRTYLIQKRHTHTHTRTRTHTHTHARIHIYITYILTHIDL